MAQGGYSAADKSMKDFLTCWVLVVLLCTGTATATGRSVPKQIGKPQAQTATQTEAATKEASDPLGRSTPHGTVFGFLQATQNGDYKEATQYLQLSRGERNTRGERIARQLHELMDNAFVGRVGAISESREGSVQPGVPADHERIGVFRIDHNETPVELVRVSDPSAGEIWLFSSQILADVPDLSGQIESSDLESELPQFLLTEQILSTPLWRLIAFLLLIPVSFGLAWGVVKLVHGGLRIWMRWRHHPILEDVRNSLSAPATLILTVVFHQIGIHFLGVPLLIRVYYQRLTGIILVAGVAWLVFRVINRWGERARVLALTGSGYRSGSIVVLGQRVLKVVVVIVAVLVMFSIFGFDMTTALAGLGIGSLAIAFAAQKTLENLIGGISILSDEVIRVGDTCQIGDQEGTVEDISLRSTRIRTLSRTELSVPNGQLANMNVENLSRRDKSLFQAKIELRRETTPDHLRSLLEDMRGLLQRHPKVDPNVARVRFVGFGENSIEVAIHCHILTSEFNQFLAIREELLLQIMDLVAESGIGFAFPSRMVYLTKEQVESPQRSGIVEKSTAGLRKSG